MIGDIQKPALWAIDPAAVDPYWQENFWKDCVVCLPLLENAAGALPTAVTGKRKDIPTTMTVSGGSVPWTQGIHGPALNNTSTGVDLQISFIPGQDWVPLTACTILLIRRKVDTTLRRNGIGNTGGSTTMTFYPGWIDGNIYWDFGGQTGANRLTWGGYTPTTNIEMWAAVAGSQGSAIYLDGKKVASQSTGVSRTAASSNQASILGNIPVGGSDLVEYYFLAFLDAEWTEAQVKEWVQDPYGMLRMADVGGIIVPTPAAGGTTVVINQSTLTLSGKTVFGNELAVISKSSLTLTAKTTFGNVTSQVLKSSLTLSPKTTFGNVNAIVSKSNLTLSGKLVSFLANTVVIVSKAALTLTGKLVSASTSGTVALYRRGRHRTRLLLK